MSVQVDFFNINTGEEIFLSRPAQLKAAIESSDLGVNRRSDRGWRLGKGWKNKIRQVRAGDKAFMTELSIKYGGEVTESQLLVAVFVREWSLAQATKEVGEVAQFERQYMEDISPSTPAKKVKIEVEEPTVSKVEKVDVNLPKGGASYTPAKSKK